MPFFATSQNLFGRRGRKLLTLLTFRCLSHIRSGRQVSRRTCPSTSSMGDTFTYAQLHTLRDGVNSRMGAEI